MADHTTERARIIKEGTFTEKEKEVKDFARGLINAVYLGMAIPQGQGISFVEYKVGKGGSKASSSGYHEEVQVFGPTGKTKVFIDIERDKNDWRKVDRERLDIDWLFGSPVYLRHNDSFHLYYARRYPEPTYPGSRNTEYVEEFGARFRNPDKVDPKERTLEYDSYYKIKFWEEWIHQFGKNMRLKPRPLQK